MIGTAVIGGGLSGLVRAWSLLQRGEDVILLEASPRAGGVVRTEQRDGFLLEMAQHGRPTPEILRLFEDSASQREILADPRSPVTSLRWRLPACRVPARAHSEAVFFRCGES